MQTMLERGVNAPFTSSAGRLFDAVASLTGLRQVMRFEGQAAMEMEFERASASTDETYDLPLILRRSPIVLDWAPMVEEVLSDARGGVSPGEISAKFHNALVEAIVRVAIQIDCPHVALSGGCFQNRYLTERAVTRLREEGFQPYWHQRVPPNDGGIALGQVVAARRELAGRGAAFTPLQQPNYEPLSDSRDSSLVTLKRAETRAPLSHITHHASR